jgi:trigger factor
MVCAEKERRVLVSIVELDKWKRELRIGIPSAEVDTKVEELMAELARNATADGFRKGKVPRSMIERQHGPAVRAEALSSLMGSAIADAVREAKIRPICDPVVSDIEAAPTDEHYHFTATIEVRPDVDLKEYQGLSFTERVPIVSNEDVDAAILELRERNAELVQVTRPSQPGDYVIIDYDRLDEGGAPIEGWTVQDAPYEIGAGQIPPELDAALHGVQAGDEKTVAVTFPDDARVEGLAGKTASFAVRVKEVREKRLPAVDEAFAKSVAGAATTLDLRVRVRNSLEAQARAFARRRLEEEIVGVLIDKNPLELPECLVRERLDSMRAKMSENRPEGAPEIDAEEFGKVYRPVVERQLKAGLILGAIAEKHGVEVTREDVSRRVGEIAESQGKDPAELLKDLEGTDLLSQIEDDIWLTRVHDLITGFSTVTTEQYEVPKRGREGQAPAAGADPAAGQGA